MVWLNLPLQRRTNCSLCYGQTMPSPMWEKWGLRAKAAYSPCASRHSLGWRHLTASRAILSVYSWLGTDKHSIMDKCSKLCCLLPDRSKQSTFLLESWVPPGSPVPILPQMLLQNAWRIPSVHEIVTKLLKSSVPWVVLLLGSQGSEYSGLDIRTIMTEKEALAKRNYMD